MPTVKLWKVVVLVFLPTALLYQLIWALIFKEQPVAFWQSHASHYVIVIKVIGETIMYALMSGYALCCTQSTHFISKRIVAALCAGLSLYSAYYLFLVMQ